MDSGDMKEPFQSDLDCSKGPILPIVCPLDWPFEVAGKMPLIVTSFLLASVAYFVAILPLLIAGDLHRILNVPFGIAFVGIVWVLVNVRSTTRFYHLKLKKARNVVSDSSIDSFDILLNSHIDRLQDSRQCIWGSVFLWGIFAFLMAGNWFGFINGKFLDFFMFMPIDWYQPPGVLPRYLSLALLFIPIVSLTYAPGRLILFHTIFIYKISSLNLIPSPKTCAQHMSQLINVGIMASLTWSVGIGLYVLLFKIAPTTPQIAFLIVLAAIGTSAFFLPFFAVRNALVRTNEVRNEYLLSNIISLIRQKPGSQVEIKKILEYENSLIPRDKVNELVVGWGAMGTVSVSVLIPAITSYFQPYLTTLLSSGGSP